MKCPKFGSSYKLSGGVNRAKQLGARSTNGLKETLFIYTA